jgi:hypothetical protein
MARVSDSIDIFLVPLDPLRGFQTIMSDLDRLAELDPKIREARALVEDHFRGLPSEKDLDDKLAPLLWLQVRAYIQSPVNLGVIRRWFGNGDAVLRAVNEALETTFDQETLQKVIQETGQLAQADSVKDGRLREARDELSRFGSEKDKPVAALAVDFAIVFAFGVAAGATAAYLLS